MEHNVANTVNRVPPLTAEEFASKLCIKPKCITTEDKIDFLRFIEFDEVDGKSASIEFGGCFIDNRNGFYFYYEVIDWTEYKDGEIISLDSPRRKDVIHEYLSTVDEYNMLADKVNASLCKLYNKKN